MEEIITTATENAIEATAEQVVKTGGGKFAKGSAIVVGTGIVLYGMYKGVTWLRKKYAEKKNPAGPVAESEDFDNIDVLKHDFLDHEEAPEN